MAAVQHYPARNRPEHPVCSVCIANYNGVDLLTDCLESVFGQNCDFPFEVIVHDDASTDASVAFLRERYPQVDLIASRENVGFCIGNNRMANHARGDYMLLLNNDAALYPDALATLLNGAQLQSPPGILTLPQYDWQSGELVDRGCLLDPFYNPVPNLDVARRDVAMAIGACLWIPRTLWDELGGFPEWIESICEDMYLCCLARLRGIGVWALPDSGFRHRLGASFGGARVTAQRLNTTFRRRQLSERNKTFVLFLCMPTVAMLPILVTHIVSLLLEGVILSALQLDWKIFIRIYANAARSFLREFKRLLVLRDQIQASRTIPVRSYFRAFTLVPRKLVMLHRFGLPRINV